MREGVAGREQEAYSSGLMSRASEGKLGRFATNCSEILGKSLDLQSPSFSPVKMGVAKVDLPELWEVFAWTWACPSQRQPLGGAQGMSVSWI